MRFTLVILLALSTFFSSAQVVSGLYTGTLVNDSTKKEQRYELALSEYRGKITGYSYTTFVVNDTFYYGVKRVKATRKGDLLVIEDDKMLVNNFPESPAKGVKQINTIHLNNEDTLRAANGTWETTRTKIYYALHGGVQMRLDNDSTHSALIGQLKELNIISQPHYQEAVVKTQVKKEEFKTKPDHNTTAPVANTDIRSTAKADVKKASKPAVSDEIKPDEHVVAKKGSKETIVTNNKKEPPVTVFTPALPTTIPYTQRKNRQQEAIDITSDSVVLAFYDNGVVDGDSISVYVNGENIISNNRLTAVATKKTIRLPNVETIEIILVAENLGTLPPNTGLLVVTDGDKKYHVNFSADLQTNAAIIFKRKLNK
jgi:hypothetical protein